MPIVEARPSCWTDQYLRAHCEGYRVEDNGGSPIGFVEAVVWSDEPFGEAEAVVVRRLHDHAALVVPLEKVVGVEPWGERIVLSRSEALAPARPAASRPASAVRR